MMHTTIQSLRILSGAYGVSRIFFTAPCQAPLKRHVWMRDFPIDRSGIKYAYATPGNGLLPTCPKCVVFWDMALSKDPGLDEALAVCEAEHQQKLKTRREKRREKNQQVAAQENT